MTIIATALALGSVAGTSPWTVIGMLGASNVCFLVLISNHQGSSLKRSLAALAISAVLGAIALQVFLGRPRVPPPLPDNYKTAINLSAIVDATQKHPKGTTVLGVPWKDGFVVTTLYLRNRAPVRVTNVEATLDIDAPAFHAEQITSAPSVFVTPQPPIEIGGLSVEELHKDGTRSRVLGPSPEETESVTKYWPTKRFIVKVGELYTDVRTDIGVIGSGGVTIDLEEWLFATRGEPTIPTLLALTGTYDVEFDGRLFHERFAVRTRPMNVQAQAGR